MSWRDLRNDDDAYEVRVSWATVALFSPVVFVSLPDSPDRPAILKAILDAVAARRRRYRATDRLQILGGNCEPAVMLECRGEMRASTRPPAIVRWLARELPKFAELPSRLSAIYVVRIEGGQEHEQERETRRSWA